MCLFGSQMQELNRSLINFIHKYETAFRFCWKCSRISECFSIKINLSFYITSLIGYEVTMLARQTGTTNQIFID